MYVYCFYGCKVIVQILNYNLKMAYPIDIITIKGEYKGGVEGVDPLPLDDLGGGVQRYNPLPPLSQPLIPLRMIKLKFPILNH